MNLLAIVIGTTVDVLVVSGFIALCVALRYGKTLEWRASGSVKVVPAAKPKDAPDEGGGEPS